MGTLEDLLTISIWGEGVAGKVHLEVASISATGCGSGPSPAGKNIVQLAESVKDLSTLVAALKPEQKVKTLEGGELLIEVLDKHVYINRRAEVTTADVDASNGVVHIIDTVLLPK